MGEATGRERAIGALGLMDWVQLGLVTLLAAAVQGAVGFAFTLLAVSFFLLILQSAEAVQVLLVLNLVICASLCRHLWKDVPLALWRLLLAGAVVGVPVGVAAFAYADLTVTYLAVAVVILVFTVALARQKAPRVATGSGAGSSDPAGSSDAADTPTVGVSAPYRSRSVFAVGAVAGAMTAALGMPGPVLVLYLTAIGVDKATFRAVSLTLFTALYISAILLQSATLGIPGRVWVTAAALVPLAWAGAALGHAVARHIDEILFRRFVLLLLAATGLFMLITPLTG